MIKIKQQGSGNKNTSETLYLTWKALFLLFCPWESGGRQQSYPGERCQWRQSPSTQSLELQGKMRERILAGDMGTVLRSGMRREFIEWWLSQAETQSLQHSDSELREGFLFTVIKALVAIITIVPFLRILQRMMQESSLILWFPCQKIFRASKEMGSYWVKSCLAGGEEAGWHICRLAGDSVNVLR